MEIVRLITKPGAQFHFGAVAHDENMALDNTLDRLHSDTLFSAIVNEYNNVWENDKELNTDNFISYFKDNSITISSTSYCLENNGNYIYFFPKPITSTLLVSQDFKDIRRIRFVSKGILEKGITPDKWNKQNKEVVILQDKFVCTTSELKLFNVKSDKYGDIKIYRTQDETKVKVHSLTQDDTLYNQTNIQIADNSLIAEDLSVHFWFAYTLDDEKKTYAKRFKTIVKLLLHSGIGGQRSTGCGFFEDIQFDEFNYTTVNTGYDLSLSLSYPENDADFGNFMYYDIIQRGGRTTKQYIEKNEQVAIKTGKIRMLLEGAVCKSQCKGTVVDMTFDKFTKNLEDEIIGVEKISGNGASNKVYRYGKYFAIPLLNCFVPNINN